MEICFVFLCVVEKSYVEKWIVDGGFLGLEFVVLKICGIEIL